MSLLTTLQDTSMLSGGISAAQVANMRDAMLADGKISDSEAEFLFTLKDSFKGRDNAPEWATFWVEAMWSYLHDGGNILKQVRLTWLKSRISAATTDEMEQQLLATIG